MERSLSLTSSQKKEIQEEGNVASKIDVLENLFIVDIRRLARERQLEDGTKAEQTIQETKSHMAQEM